MKRPVVGGVAAWWLAVPLLAFLLLTTERVASQTVLVDFGATSGADAFGLAGWTTPVMGPLMARASDGPGGLVADATADEYSDYLGVRGSARRFTTADRIVVTWYNRSDEVVRFTARISFTDADQPDGGSSSGRWYTMRRADNYRDTWTEAGPQETVQTMFVVTGEGTHKTDSTYALVNVNLAIEWGMSDRKQFLVCDRIELYEDADVTPPAAPTGLRTTEVTSSKIRFEWDVPSDNVGVVDFLVYVDGEIEGYSRENSYTCVFLNNGNLYQISVSARDMMLNESARSVELPVSTAPYSVATPVVSPDEIEYLGAFRLPDEFFWGGEDIAYRSDGDASGPGDGFPGSLFVTNVNQPENGLVGEVSIPAAMTVNRFDELPVADMLTAPVNVRPPQIDAWDFVDIWRMGLEYLPAEQRLYSAWSVHYTVTGEKHANISCTSVTGLITSPRLGPWNLGAAAQPPIDAQMGDWLFTLPASWAAQHASGRSLVVGRCRDGGLSGLGPTLYAFSPAGNSPPATNAILDFTTLLEYGSVESTDNYHFPNSIDGYKHSDDWRGACWIDAGARRSAVAVIGRKAHGDNWYGYTGERMPHDWIIADVPYYAFDETDPDGKGWRAHRRSPMIILYDPVDLAAVASGSSASFEPQPYAALRITPGRFFSEECEIFSAGYDPLRHILYVTEFVRDPDGALVVHAFRINDLYTGVDDDVALTSSPQLECYPNPVRASAVLSWRLPFAGAMKLSLYDVLGREISVLADGSQPAGAGSMRFDARDLRSAPGIIFAVLRTDAYIHSITIPVVK